MTKIDELDSDKLLNLHIEQLAKEKKDLAEKLRLVGKRVDHMERAYRKEERELLADDYERQKAQDKESHEALIKSSREDAIAKHKYEQDLKARLARMMPDYLVSRQAVASQHEKEFQESKTRAQNLIKEEKEKFRSQLLAKKKAEKAKREQERQRREEQERLRAGMSRISFMVIKLTIVEEEDRQAAEEAALAEEEAKKKEEIEARTRAQEAEVAERKAKREAERAADAEKIRKQLEREEEAAARRRNGGSGAGVRRPDSATPSTTTPTATGGRPQVLPAQPGGWRERLAAKQAAEAAGETPSAPAAPAAAAPPARDSPTTRAPESPVTREESIPGQERGQRWQRGMGGRGRGGAPPSTRGAPAAGGSRW